MLSGSHPRTALATIPGRWAGGCLLLSSVLLLLALPRPALAQTTCRTTSVAITGITAVTVTFVRGHVDNPAGPHAFQSGLGVLSGWGCEAEAVAIVFETAAGEDHRFEAAYGTEREDGAVLRRLGRRARPQGKERFSPVYRVWTAHAKRPKTGVQRV